MALSCESRAAGKQTTCLILHVGLCCWKNRFHSPRRSGRAALPGGEESVLHLIGRWQMSQISAASSSAPPSPARLRSAAAACLHTRKQTHTQDEHSYHMLLYTILLISKCTELTFPFAFSVRVCVCVCVCVSVSLFVHIFSSPFWSLMSTAACDSSSRVMSSRFPLSAAWCSGENL